MVFPVKFTTFNGTQSTPTETATPSAPLGQVGESETLAHAQSSQVGQVGRDDLSRHSSTVVDPERVTYQMVPVAPPIDPADVESGDRAVEVVVMWGDNSILHVEHLCPPRSFSVGDRLDSKGTPTSDFLIGSESLGAEMLPITVDSADGVAVVVPHGADGDIVLQDRYFAFTELAAHGLLQPCSLLVDAQQYTLPPEATARINYRGFTFVVRPVNAGRTIGIGGPQVDWRGYSWTLASMMLHLSLLLLFYFLPPSSAALSLDLLSADDRFARYLIEQDALVDVQTPDWLPNVTEEDNKGGQGKRHKEDDGQMGKRDEKKSDNTFGVPGPADNEQPVMARDEEMAANAGIIGILKASVGAFNSPTSPYGADAALGADPIAAMGAILGDQLGSNFGFGGLGSSGTGRGGGGTGDGTVGLGNLGTTGHNAGGGSGPGYGVGPGGFRGRSSKVPRVRPAKADVHGSLAKEVVRRIVRRHVNEVRFCYEQELNARPDLQGRVAVKFLVSPTGVVQTAVVAKSTLSHHRVEQCMLLSAMTRAVRRSRRTTDAEAAVLSGFCSQLAKTTTGSRRVTRARDASHAAEGSSTPSMSSTAKATGWWRPSVITHSVSADKAAVRSS